MKTTVRSIRFDNALLRRVLTLAEQEKRTFTGTIIWIVKSWFERVRK